jgi:hypothetical protein
MLGVMAEFTAADWQNQDDCLIAITDGKPVPTRALKALPPWRAVLMARVAAKAGVPLEHGSVTELVAEARRVGGGGRLAEWWQQHDGPAS